MKKMICLTIGLLSASISHAAESRFETLEKKFQERGNTLTKEILEGTYLGRCFFKGSDDASGSLLMTKKISRTAKASGPNFSSVTTSSWHMAIAQYSSMNGIINEAPETNDSVTKEDVETFWAENGVKFPLKIANDIASSIDDVILERITVDRPNTQAPVRIQAKLNADGYIYTKSTVILKKNNPTLEYLHLSRDTSYVGAYCYYWKKVLNP